LLHWPPPTIFFVSVRIDHLCGMNPAIQHLAATCACACPLS
jgi:hypothetical protein